MGNDKVISLRKLSQQYAYSSIQMHKTIAKKLEFSRADHKYLGFFLQRGKLITSDLEVK